MFSAHVLHATAPHGLSSVGEGLRGPASKFQWCRPRRVASALRLGNSLASVAPIFQPRLEAQRVDDDTGERSPLSSGAGVK